MGMAGNVHLLPSVNQPLLRRRDAFFLLDALLYPRDLDPVSIHPNAAFLPFRILG
jgi:hypothetical protein